MWPLIGVLIAVVLTSYFMLSGTNSLNTTAIQSSSYVEEIELATTSLSNSIDGYRLAKGVPLPESNWQTHLQEFNIIPVLSFDSRWSYEVDGSTEYVCLISVNGNSVVKAYDYLVDKYPNQYSIDNKCQKTLQANEIIISHKLQ